jgi:hypothetical protein
VFLKEFGSICPFSFWICLARSISHIHFCPGMVRAIRGEGLPLIPTAAVTAFHIIQELE